MGDDDIIIAHADNLSICNYRAFIQVYRDRPEGTIGTMMTFSTDTPGSCGIISLDEVGRIAHYWEKDSAAEGNLANAAVYVASPEFCDIVAEADAFDLSKDVIPLIYRRLNTFHNGVYHRDIGTLASYSLAQVEYLALRVDWTLPGGSA